MAHTKMSTDSHTTWPTHRFTFEGRSYTLEKRGGVWYTAFTVHCRRYHRSLETDSHATAALRAKTIIRAALAEKWGLAPAKTAEKPAAPTCSIGRLLSAYRLQAVDIKPRTVNNNVNSLAVIVRRGLAQPGLSARALDDLPASTLTGALVATYVRDALARADSDPAALETAKRTCASYLRQARSITSPKMLRAYARAGLTLPNLTEWNTEESPRPRRSIIQPPSDTEMESLLEHSDALKSQEPLVWFAWWIALWTGMRRGEIDQCRWSWFSSDTLTVPAEAAKGGRARSVPLHPRILADLATWRDSTKPADDTAYLLPGSAGSPGLLRLQNIYRRVGDWMKSLGWQRRQKLHAMRERFGAQWRKAHGLGAAQAALGHADQRTTQDHYAGMEQIASPVNVVR